MENTKLNVIKGTPYLFQCEVTESDFNYMLNKLEKLHSDLTQMKKLGNQEKVDINYVLNAIEDDKY